MNHAINKFIHGLGGLLSILCGGLDLAQLDLQLGGLADRFHGLVVGLADLIEHRQQGSAFDLRSVVAVSWRCRWILASSFHGAVEG
jgi:hypothetical protein